MEETKPWEQQQPGEKNLWFRRFQAYMRLGPRRSMLSAYVKELEQRGLNAKGKKLIPSSWRDNARKWKWLERAEAWDAYVAEQEAAEWDAKRRQLRDQEWESAQALIDKARQMLVFPLARTQRAEKDVDGRVVAETVIIPAKWSMRDAAAMFDTASKLMRLAAELETGRLAVDWMQEARKAGLDPDKLRDEFVEFFKRQLAQPQSPEQPGNGSAARGKTPTGSGGASEAGAAG